MVYRHHIHSNEARIPVPDSHHCLAQPLYRRMGTGCHTGHQSLYRGLQEGIPSGETRDPELGITQIEDVIIDGQAGLKE